MLANVLPSLPSGGSLRRSVDANRRVIAYMAVPSQLARWGPIFFDCGLQKHADAAATKSFVLENDDGKILNSTYCVPPKYHSDLPNKEAHRLAPDKRGEF